MIKKIKTSHKSLFESILIYLKMMTPFHGVTKDKEIRALASLMNKHYEISKNVSKDEYINKLLFDPETKKAISDEVGMSRAEFNNFIHNMNKKGIIKEHTIRNGLLPPLDKDGNIEIHIRLEHK